MRTPRNPTPQIPDLRLSITDTLGNPFVEEEWLPQVYEPVAKSRRDANKVKKEQPITVVIGNPPYKEKAEGRGGWIEAGTGGKLTAPLDRWKPPPEWGVGAHAKHLKNLYVYFWRWATWKVFGSGHYAATGFPDKDEEGIVCFITVAGFLNGPGFEKMRDDLRRTCSEIWVIDCSPEGHQRTFRPASSKACSSRCASCLPPASSAKARTSRHKSVFKVWQRAGARRSLLHSLACHSMPQVGSTLRRAGAIRSWRRRLDSGLHVPRSATCSFTMARA